MSAADQAPAAVSAGGGDGEPSPRSGSSSPLDHEVIQQHPEILVGAAFAGAFVLAQVLKALGRRD